jgi:hypothetical protein
MYVTLYEEWLDILSSQVLTVCILHKNCALNADVADDSLASLFLYHLCVSQRWLLIFLC